MLKYIDLKYRPTSSDLVAEYYLEPNRIPFEKAVEHIAAESSIGTWTDVHTMDVRTAMKLKPHAFFMDKKKGLAKIAYSEELFEEGNMPQIQSSIAGNIFGMNIVKNLRLLDIHFPQSIIQSFKGPRYGIDGIRQILRVKNRPLVGTIVKPKIGLSATKHALVAYDAWIGGCDIVKDDENLTSQKFNTFETRIKETLDMRERAELKTGEKKIYMPNVTAETGVMMRRAKFAKRQGCEYAMIDVMTAGLSAVQTLREADLGLVIHAHRAGHAAVTRNPKHGISMLAIAKCMRLIGVDQLHIGTGVGKMQGPIAEVEEIEEEMESRVMRSHKDVLGQQWYNVKPVLAVCSGGLHPGLVPKLMQYMGNNIVIQAGGGIHGHPDGTTKGAVAMRQAVDASLQGISLRDYAKTHYELSQAIHLWNSR